MGVYKSTTQDTDSVTYGSQLRPVSLTQTDPVSATSKALQIRELYLQYHEELCCSLMKKFDISHSEAEDYVQTAYTRYAESSKTVENPRAFLYKTCSNLLIDQLRRRQVQMNYARTVIDSDQRVEEAGPERLVEGRQRLDIISKALWAMPGRRRKLLMMSRIEGLSYAEIARRVNLSETVVRKLIAKAMAACQKALQAQNK
ncbi:MAG: sigma-70 family RNA polymerase sigma factor [Spongiibacteraceae bacterium]|nr:sigma-70 family RNA polymerase sigma factor [Spongiibacteraceae bacterium]